MAASTRVLRLRVVVLFVWLVAGLVVLSDYTWSRYDGPPSYPHHHWTQMGRDLLFCLADDDPPTPSAAYPSGSARCDHTA